MKTLKIAVLTAGALLLAGCGQKVSQNSADNSATKNPVPQTEEKSAASSVISSIADAMASGQTMKCDYSMKDKDGNETKMSMYVSGKKYMSSTSVAGNIQHVIFDEEAMYSWAEGQTKGIKMTTACTQEMAKNAPQSASSADQNAPDPTGEDRFKDAVDVSCSAANNIDFSIPSNVTFTDQCEMMKNLQKSLPANLPTGVMPSVPTNLPSVPQL